VNLSAGAAPCTAEFRIWLLPPGVNTWIELTNGYTTTPTLVWNTTERQAGTHTLALWARGVGSTAAWETTDTLTYALALDTDAIFSFFNASPTAIPDAGTINTLVAATNVTGYVSRVEIELHITHTRSTDLDLTLLAPDGTSVLLAADRGLASAGYGTSCSNIGVTRFSDEAPTSIAQATGTIVGTYRPESPLFVFTGRTGAAVNGTWTLRIADDESTNTGTFQCWILRIHTTITPPRTGQRPVPTSPPPAVEEPRPAPGARAEERVTR
jgi:subtilisin-like proprotein convertase family protein